MKWFFTAVCVFCVVVLFVTVTVNVNAYKEDSESSKSQEIVKSVSVGDISIGGKNKAEAREILEEYVSSVVGKVLTVRVGSKVYSKTYGELGYTFNISEAVNEAYEYGRSGNFGEDAKDIYGLKERNISLSKFIDQKKIKSFVSDLKACVDKKPVNASITKGNGGLVISSSAQGYILDRKSTEDIIMQAMANQQRDVYLNPEKQMPEISAESLRSIDKKLGSYSTDFNPAKKDRCINLAVACKKADGTVLMPGETFSFNGTVGPRNAKNGFRNAIVFQDGQEVEGMGGGICQVSSTMFNTVLLSGLEIVSRRNHSLKVHYVPLGRDAMVSYGSSDFRFRNNTKYPLVLFITKGTSKLNCEIWGNSSAYKKCTIETSVSADKFSASLVRYIYDGAGNRKADYKTSSKYQKPKPKEKPENQENSNNNSNDISISN